MTDGAKKPVGVGALKSLLLETLAEQIENGVTIVDKEGVEHTVDVGAPVLAVAAKFVKDWADEIEKPGKEKELHDKLSTFLAERRPDINQGTKAN